MNPKFGLATWRDDLTSWDASDIVIPKPLFDIKYARTILDDRDTPL